MPYSAIPNPNPLFPQNPNFLFRQCCEGLAETTIHHLQKKFSRSPITGCVSLEMPFQYIHKELCLSELTICYFLSCAFLPFFSYKKCFSDEMGAQLRLLLIYNIVLAKAGITRLVVRPWALATLWLAINVPFLS
jgi:hypothetical protein